MSKKSAEHFARDNYTGQHQTQKKQNSCWDDLNEIHSTCVKLITSHTNLSQYAQDKELINAVADKATLTENIRLLAKDLGKLNEELTEIYSQHSGNTGGSQNPDVVMQSISISEHYNLFMERHEAVVMPTVMHILEQFGQAEDVINKNKHIQQWADIIAKESEAAATDVSVITDVAITSETIITKE